MGYRLTLKQAQSLFNRLEDKYDIYAPKRFKAEGRYSDTDIIKYEKITSILDVEYKTKSTYPLKEVIAPIQQTLFYFTEDEYRASKGKTKPLLVFARACDINAIKIQSKIYLGNGGFSDFYYQRMLDRVKFIFMECLTQTDTCFCVSMNSNKTDNYSLAMRITDQEVFVQVKDKEFEKYFKNQKKMDFKPTFVKENKTKVMVPEIKNREILNRLKAHKMWKEFDGRCISCGACTIACSTCTCFTTRDLIYGDNPEVGERRRVESSCQIDGFTTVAGGASYRKTAGEKMRFKVLHKFHDYKERFKDSHMCVGCGRCTDRCPELISLTHTLEKMTKAISEIEEEMKNE